MYKIKYFIVIGVIVSWVLAACQNPVEHTAPAIHNRDSVAMMTSYGVNTLISDSGVIKYRIVTERWEVNTNPSPISRPDQSPRFLWWAQLSRFFDAGDRWLW